MVTSISLGGISEQNGRTVVSGTSSGGIDTEALLESLTAAKRLPAVQLESRITSNETVSAKYAELQDILSSFQDASDFLRSPPGVGNEDENIFEYRTATLGGNTSGTTSNYLSISAQPGADISSYDITVDQLASYNTKITETFSLADADTDAVGAGLPFNAGTFSLGAAAVDVTLEADDTLNQVVAKINAVSDESFVRASIIQVSDGEYRLSLKTTQTGAEYNYDLSDTYIQSGNEIVIEAEDFQAQTDRSGFGYSVQADAAASDGEYIETAPDVGAFVNASIETTSPQTDYRVRFDEAGDYYLWVLGRGTSNDDSLHIGLDGTVPNTAKDMFGGNSATPASFVWNSGNLNDNPSRLTIAEAGVHTVNVFMREDGQDLDKIILTTDAGFVPAGNAQASTLQQSGSVFNVAFAVDEDAQDAQLTVDGTTVSRSNNSIDDVIDGVTFNLLAETGVGEEITANIGADTDIAKTAIINFVDSYNEFRIFAAEQSETDDDGAPSEDAVLSSSSTLRTILARVNAEVATVVDGIADGNFDRLADIGLSFTDYDGDSETPFTRNIITVDETTLDSALAANFDQVRSLFEFDFTTDDPDLTIFSRTNGLGVTDVVLNIDQTNETYEATYTDPTLGLITIALSGETLSSGSGIVLTAPDDSSLSGLVLLYANSGDSTVNLSLTQGIGDRMYNALDDVLDDETGLLVTELDSLSDTNSRLEDEILRIDEQVERYRDSLLSQFSALETAIANAEVILQSLAANADARAAS